MTTLSLPIPVPADTLHGDVVCERVGSRSVLTRVRSTNPLKLLTPRTNGDAAQVVLSSYGGGLLGGDHVEVRLDVRPGATLAVTTQSAGKVYRTEDRPAEQVISATVADGATLAVLPDPLCAFADARFRQQQTFDLAADANLIWLDWITSGRHGRGERWRMRDVESRATVRVAGRAVLRETLALDGGHDAIASPLRLGRFNAYAVLAFVGPRLAAMAERAQAVLDALPLDAQPVLLAAASVMTGGRVIRVLGPDAQTVGRLLVELLSPLADVIGHDPWARKW